MSTIVSHLVDCAEKGSLTSSRWRDGGYDCAWYRYTLFTVLVAAFVASLTCAHGVMSRVAFCFHLHVCCGKKTVLVKSDLKTDKVESVCKGCLCDKTENVK